VKVNQAYKFALDPTPAQERMLRSHAGAARFAWNWGLAKCVERYEAEGKWYSAIDLHKLWNAEKKADPALSWWSDNSKCAYQEAFRGLDRALRDFVKSRKGERKGKRLGFPRFKKRGKARDSFRFGSGVMRWRTVRPASCRPRSPARHSAGSCRSPWRPSGTCRSGTRAPGRRSASTWASRHC
jgi:putative transposase